MADQRFTFSSHLADLVEQAQIAGNVLDESFIRDFFSDLHLGEKEMNHLFAYLKASHIEIRGYETNEEVEKEVLDYKKAAKERLEATSSNKDEEESRDSEDKEEKTGKKKPKSEFLSMYFEDLSCLEKLDEKSELSLLKQVIDGDERAEREYIERKLLSVVDMARGFDLEEIYFEEVIEEGNIGLLLAVKELKKGKDQTNPKELVDAHILSAMQDYLDESLHVENAENSMVAKVGFVSDAAKALKEEKGVNPTLMELAAYTNLTEEELLEIMKLSADLLKE